MLVKIFSGSLADTSRFSVPGMIVMALGVLLSAFARRLADGGKKKVEHWTLGRFGQDRKVVLYEFVGKHENLYFVFKIGGLLITMIGALITVKVFG